MYLRKKIVYLALLTASFYSFVHAQVVTHYQQKEQQQIFTLSNTKVTQQIVVDHHFLHEDALLAKTDWLTAYHNTQTHEVYTDADFALKMMWTDWSAPGKDFNGDLQLSLTKRDFVLQRYEFIALPNNGKELNLYFTPVNKENSLQLRITYQLLDQAFYARRKIAIQDTSLQKNWIEVIVSRSGKIFTQSGYNAGYSMREENSASAQYISLQLHPQAETDRIVKQGDFGQPCAINFSGGGVFFGIEYPAANSSVVRNSDMSLQLNCKELMGKVVKQEWIESSWVVEGLAPNHAIQDWFYDYINDIKAAPDKPYALYNSWYDLRSPSYPHVEPNHVMNEKNILHIIDLFKKNMTDKYGIHLDAFVLDDGWDVYESNWMLNKTAFPNDIQPIVNALKPMGTTLGIWLGPTGGYSFRMKRINWMKAHGYETVGTTSNDAMLDIAGPDYSRLFEQRVTDFTRQGVGYFKWDGIQFSSSEATNGHPVGYHSRRAAVESIIEKCKAVRAINPNEYLNITSGTWLSPWWLQYANQIWMQGADYGYANTPVINDRDAAMTYKDIVLYDDFNRQNVWFPLNNMMTHGIIKGNLASIGGNDDPLHKFADDVVFYFGRGVTMYELYLSPDLLHADEWEVLSRSLNWAKQNFSVLDKTYMIGGNPAVGNAYGFVHFKNDSGIIAVRNPKIQTQQLTVQLSSQQGLVDTAASLVLERVYPTHWIAPDLYAADATITLPALQGFEVAVYQVYPVQNAKKPLLANAVMNIAEQNGPSQQLRVMATTGKVQLLNPWMVKAVKVSEKEQNINDIQITQQSFPAPIAAGIQFSENTVSGTVTIDAHTTTTRLVVMLQPDSSNMGKPFPHIQFMVNGQKLNATKQLQDGHWGSYSIVLENTGKHDIRFEIGSTEKVQQWNGTAFLWAITQQVQPIINVTLSTWQAIDKELLLPDPYAKGGALPQTQLLASGPLKL